MDEFSVLTVKELFESEIDGLRELIENESNEDKIKMYNIVIAYLQHRVETGNPLWILK